MGAPRPGRRDRAFSSPLFAPAFAMRAIYHRPWGRKTFAGALAPSPSRPFRPRAARGARGRVDADHRRRGRRPRRRHEPVGALGYAKHGWSYQQILAHYYTGTALGRRRRARPSRCSSGRRWSSCRSNDTCAGSCGRDAVVVAAGGAGGPGDREPDVRVDERRRRTAVRCLLRHALADVSGRGRGNSGDRTPRSPRPPGRS